MAQQQHRSCSRCVHGQFCVFVHLGWRLAVWSGASAVGSADSALLVDAMNTSVDAGQPVPPDYRVLGLRSADTVTDVVLEYAGTSVWGDAFGPSTTPPTAPGSYSVSVKSYKLTSSDPTYYNGQYKHRQCRRFVGCRHRSRMLRWRVCRRVTLLPRSTPLRVQVPLVTRGLSLLMVHRFRLRVASHSLIRALYSQFRVPAPVAIQRFASS